MTKDWAIAGGDRRETSRKTRYISTPQSSPVWDAVGLRIRTVA